MDAGIYDKGVVINKHLKLIGKNKDTTKIDGEGSEKCIQVTADNVEICNFTIRNGFYGVYLESSNCRVINNSILSVTFDGISLRNSVNNTIAHNRLSLVKGDGIHLSSSSNNRIHDNDLSENGGGISLSGSHNNTISNNSLTDNSNRGIRLSSSNRNLIRNNDLSGSEEGIFLRGCNKNSIYHNNIINNTNQAKDITGTNSWDYGPKDGGNYWSDHECTGNPSDGNQPYNISGGMGAKDNYPFMDKDGWLLTCTPPSSPTLTDPGTTDTDGNYTVSWSSVSSATSYTLEEDTTSSFSSPTVVYSGPETSKDITGKSEGTYYYQVNASNACGCSEWSNIKDITIKIDTKTPVISHEPITNATGGVSIPICATITDDTKVANATLHYRITGEEAWITISMTHIGDNYSAIIPPSHVTTVGVQYYIEAVDDAANTAYKPATALESSYSITVKVNVGYAIIIAGRRDDGCARKAINISANNTYCVLLKRGFTDERIFYLNPNLKQGVDNISWSTKIKSAINEWAAKDKVSVNVPLLIYMVGHGGNDTFIINGDNDNLTASDLNKSLNHLTNETGCDDIMVFYEAIFSGSFIDNLSGDGRIIVTSTGANPSSKYHKRMGGVFSYYFFDNVSTGKTIKDAFETALNSSLIKRYSKTRVDEGYPPQTPRLNGSLAETKYIGTRGEGQSHNSCIPAIRFGEV